MGKLKFEANPGLFTTLSDRFSSEGYKKNVSFDEGLDMISTIKDVDGVGFWGPGQVTLENCENIADRVRQMGKKPAVIVVDVWNRKWAWGSLTNKSEAIREEAIATVCESMDIAAKMGVENITLWLAHDGVDYPFQADYSKVWGWMVDGMKRIADHNPAIKIGMEYKVREPRIHQFVANLGDTMCLMKDVDRDNVGVTLDLGHALISGERIAYSAVRLLECGKLFNTHWGDNYRLWDDDVIVGTSNPLEFIEVVYWLHKYNWDGWCALDQYPFKNNAVDAATESIKWVRGFEKLIEKIGMDELGGILNQDEPKAALRLLREAMFDVL